MSTIFSKIIKGEIPSYKIAENKYCYAFLDINPLQQGHTLVIPKVETDYLFDLEDSLLKELITFSKKIAKAIEETIECERIGLTVIGLEVPHAHIHLIPIKGLNDMNFSKEKLKLTSEEFESIAKEISTKLI
jgi:histidine triad (HIT) family protein